MRSLSVMALGMVCVAAAAQPGCRPDEAVRGAAMVKQQRAGLLKIVSEMSAEDVPAPVGARLQAFKDVLIFAVDGSMQCAPAKEEAAKFTRRLARLLDANEPEKPFRQRPESEPNDEVYGPELRVAAAPVPGWPKLRAVTLTFGIECGVDAMLLMYEAGPEGWKRVLLWRSQDYSKIDGAFGDFFHYAVIAGKSAGQWRVVVAHGTDWCQSRWSRYRVDLLEPSDDPSTPRVVWHDRDGYVRDDTEFRLKAKPEGFEMRMDVGTIESVQMVRLGIFRYRVNGDKVERLTPIAADSRGFVDAWLQAPWTDASRWSGKDHLAELEEAHRAFSSGRQHEATFTYGPVRACRTRGVYLIEIGTDSGSPTYFTLREGHNGYVMSTADRTAYPQCAGPDLMKKPGEYKGR